MAVDVQSLGSQSWLDGSPVLTRSCSTISLYSAHCVSKAFRAKGISHRVKQKAARGLGLDYRVHSNGLHGGGSVSVQKVHTMRAIGSHANSVTGVSSGADLEKQLNMHLEKTKQRLHEARLKMFDRNPIKPEYRSYFSEPDDLSQRQKDSTKFNQTTYWSNFLRGVYPSSLPVDELLSKDDERPEDYVYSRSVQDLVAEKSQEPDSIELKQLHHGQGVDLNDGDYSLTHDEDDTSDRIPSSNGEDEWGPLSIPDSMTNIFGVDDLSVDQQHNMFELQDMADLKPSDPASGVDNVSDSGTDNNSQPEDLEILPNFGEGYHVSDPISSDTDKDTNAKVEMALQDLEKSFSAEVISVDEPLQAGTDFTKEDLPEFEEDSVSLQSFEDQPLDGPGLPNEGLKHSGLYESIEDLSHL